MNRHELIMNYAGDLISLTALALIVGLLTGCLATYLYYRQKEHIREKLLSFDGNVTSFDNTTTLFDKHVTSFDKQEITLKTKKYDANRLSQPQ